MMSNVCGMLTVGPEPSGKSESPRTVTSEPKSYGNSRIGTQDWQSPEFSE